MGCIIYEFKFRSIYTRSKNLSHTVYARSLDDLSLFFRQHNFTNVTNDQIKVLDVDNPTNGEFDMFMLKPFKFKSNNDDKTYIVMTNQSIVDGAIEEVSNDLTDSLLLGEAIMRRDIEVFKLIGDIIVKKLKHALVLDFSLADTESNKDDYKLINEEIDLTKTFHLKIDHPCGYESGYYIQQTFEDVIVDDQVYPITVECYIEYFTGMIVDKYE